MLSRFFGERVGGVRFFEILNHHKLDPLINYPVLELQHACLALGFQGMHRANPTGGLASLQQIQRDLYETLRRVRPKVDARSVAALAGPGAGHERQHAAGAGLGGRAGRRCAAVRAVPDLAHSVERRAEAAAEMAATLHSHRTDRAQARSYRAAATAASAATAAA